MSKLWKMVMDTIICLSRKHCGKRRNCSLRVLFPFSHNVVKSCLLSMRQNEYLWCKGLTHYLTIPTFSEPGENSLWKTLYEDEKFFSSQYLISYHCLSNSEIVVCKCFQLVKGIRLSLPPPQPLIPLTDTRERFCCRILWKRYKIYCQKVLVRFLSAALPCGSGHGYDTAELLCYIVEILDRHVHMSRRNAEKWPSPTK